VLDDPFADFKGQVQAGERSIPLLELLDDSQRVQIMVEEKPVLPHASIERSLAGVPEWRVADVVDQRQHFREFLIQAELLGNGPRDLSDFQRVR
jgi:hypothetical protein